MMLHLKIGADDAAAYGHPDWVLVDLTGLDDEPLDVLAGYEQQVGPVDALLRSFGAGSDVAKAGLLWLARTRAGIKTPPFREFQVMPRKIKRSDRLRPGDAGPPASGSSEPTPQSSPDSPPAE